MLSDFCTLKQPPTPTQCLERLYSPSELNQTEVEFNYDPNISNFSLKNTKKHVSENCLGPWAETFYPPSDRQQNTNNPYLSSNLRRPHPSSKIKQKVDTNKNNQRQANSCIKCNGYKSTINTCLSEINDSNDLGYVYHNTSGEEKLKWCLELQLMLKKKKRLSNMLRMKQPVHIRSTTIHTQKNCLPEKPRMNIKQFMQTIDSQKFEETGRNSLVKKGPKLFDKNQHSFQFIKASQNIKYMGLTKKKWRKQDQNKSQRTLPLDSLMKQHKSIHSRTLRLDTQQSYRNYKDSSQSKNHQSYEDDENVTKIQSVKQKLKRMKYSKGKNKEKHIRNLVSGRQQKDKWMKQNTIEAQPAGFGSLNNEIDSCTITKINYSIQMGSSNKKFKK